MPIIALFLLLYVVFTGWRGKLGKTISDAEFFSSRTSQVAPWQAQSQTGAQSFSVGSTRREVRDVQGMPSWVQGDSWHYGSSQVQFRKGKVKGWSSSPESPLKVGMVPADASIAVALSSLKIGAGKDDVLRIHGTPSRLDDDVWEYGSSKVFFRDGRVVGWSDSPASPLLVEGRSPSKDKAAAGETSAADRAQAPQVSVPASPPQSH